MKLLIIILSSIFLFNSKSYACASCVDLYSCEEKSNGKQVSVTGNFEFNKDESGETQLGRLQIYYDIKTIFYLDSISDELRESMESSDKNSFSAVNPQGKAANITRDGAKGLLLLVSNGTVTKKNLINCEDYEPEY